jgi:hypothetical protein
MKSKTAEKKSTLVWVPPSRQMYVTNGTGNPLNSTSKLPDITNQEDTTVSARPILALMAINVSNLEGVKSRIWRSQTITKPTRKSAIPAKRGIELIAYSKKVVPP